MHAQVEHNMEVIEMFKIDLYLLVCTIVHSHFQQKGYVLCHDFFHKTQHGNPSSFHVVKDFIPLRFHDLGKFCKLQMSLGRMCKVCM
jgi:hypothetical protein